jgi:hypothetical protein
MADNPLVGAWKLVGYECKVGERKLDPPLGPDAVGYILYTESGHGGGEGPGRQYLYRLLRDL